MEQPLARWHEGAGGSRPQRCGWWPLLFAQAVGVRGVLGLHVPLQGDEIGSRTAPGVGKGIKSAPSWIKASVEAKRRRTKSLLGFG